MTSLTLLELLSFCNSA